MTRPLRTIHDASYSFRKISFSPIGFESSRPVLEVTINSESGQSTLYLKFEDLIDVVNYFNHELSDDR